MRSSVLTPPRPTLTGSTTPRLWTRPLVVGPPGPCGCGCALTPATSRGFSAVDFAEQVLEIRLFPWQRWLLIHALELRPGGRFRFRYILVLVARQAGKTSLVEIKNLWKMFVLKVPLVIGTAQDLDTAEESWDKAVEIAESVPELAAEIAHVDKTNGKKALKLTHGSRWKIKAASRRGGRGLAGDDVNLDELREHATWDAWGAVTKTTMARAKAQIWAYSNAGDDKSVVLNALQAQGRAAAKQLVEFLAQMVVAEAEDIAAAAAAGGVDTTFGHFEWSGPDGITCTCDRDEGDPGDPNAEREPHAPDCQLQDRQAWAQANPSLGYPGGVTEEALASALTTDPAAIFITECLCTRVPTLKRKRVISAQEWQDLVDEKSRRGEDLAIAFDVEPNLGHGSISVFSPREDGREHVELVDYRRGTRWIVARLVELKERYNPIAIGVDRSSPAASLLPDLEKAGITVPEDPDEPRRGDLVVLGAQDVATAFGAFLGAVEARLLVHIDQEQVNRAVDGLTPRNIGDGAQGWARRIATVDIGPIVAPMVARFAYKARVDLVVDEEIEPEAYWV